MAARNPRRMGAVRNPHSSSSKIPPASSTVTIEHSREFIPSRSPSIHSGVVTPPLARRMRSHFIRPRPTKAPVMVDSSSNGSPPDAPQADNDVLKRKNSVKSKKSSGATLKRTQSSIRRARSAKIVKRPAIGDFIEVTPPSSRDTNKFKSNPQLLPNESPLPVHLPPTTTTNLGRQQSMLLIRSKSTSRGTRLSPVRRFFAKIFRHRRWRLLNRVKAGLQRKNARKVVSKSSYTKDDLERQLSFEVIGSSGYRSERFRPPKFNLVAFHPHLRRMTPTPVSSSHSHRSHRLSNAFMFDDIKSELSSSGDDISDSSRISDTSSAASSLTSQESELYYLRHAPNKSNNIKDISARQGSKLRRYPSLKAPRPIRLQSPNHIHQLDQSASHYDSSPRGGARLSRGISKREQRQSAYHPILRRKDAYTRLGRTSLLDAISLSNSISSSGGTSGNKGSLYTSGNELEEAIEFVDTWSQYLKRAIAVRVVLRQEIHSWEQQDEKIWRRSQGLSSDSASVFSCLTHISDGSSCSTCSGSCSCSCSRSGSMVSSENWVRGVVASDPITTRPSSGLTRNSSIRAVGHTAGPLRMSERHHVNGRSSTHAPIWFKNQALDLDTFHWNQSDWSETYDHDPSDLSPNLQLAPRSGIASSSSSSSISFRNLHRAPSSGTGSSIGSSNVASLRVNGWTSKISISRSSSVSSSSFASDNDFCSASHVPFDFRSPANNNNNSSAPNTGGSQIPRKVTGPRAMNTTARGNRQVLKPSPLRDTTNGSASAIHVPKRRWSMSSPGNNPAIMDMNEVKSLSRRPLPPIPGKSTRSVSMPLQPQSSQQKPISPPRPIRRGGANKRRAISNNLNSLGSAWTATTSPSNRSFGSWGSSSSSGGNAIYKTPLTALPSNEEEEENIENVEPMGPPGSPTNPITID